MYFASLRRTRNRFLKVCFETLVFSDACILAVAKLFVNTIFRIFLFFLIPPVNVGKLCEHFIQYIQIDKFSLCLLPPSCSSPG